MFKRVEAVNELIKEIANQERAFFLNKSGNGLIANFQLKDSKLYYQDEEEGETKEITTKNDPVKLEEWVSHGSTIRQQIIAFATYIFTGEPQKMLSRYWGISFDAQKTIHKKAYNLGYIAYKGFVFHDYGKKYDRYLCDECGENEAFSKCEKGSYLCPMCENVHYRMTGHRTESIRGN